MSVKMVQLTHYLILPFLFLGILIYICLLFFQVVVGTQSDSWTSFCIILFRMVSSWLILLLVLKFCLPCGCVGKFRFDRFQPCIKVNVVQITIIIYECKAVTVNPLPNSSLFVSRNFYLHLSYVFSGSGWIAIGFLDIILHNSIQKGEFLANLVTCVGILFALCMCW